VPSPTYSGAFWVYLGLLVSFYIGRRGQRR